MKEIKIPLTSNAGFDEVLDDDDGTQSDQPVSVDKLVQLLEARRTADTEMRVRLTQLSPDVVACARDADDDDDVDLPRDSDINLTRVVAESCVLTSVSSPDSAAFHLPLRTDIDVRLVRYLDRFDYIRAHLSINQSINLLKAKGPNGHLHHSIKYTK